MARGVSAPRARHKAILASVVRQYAGSRSLRYMADEVARRSGVPCSEGTIEHAIWNYRAAPTRYGQWLTAHQAATLLGCSPQWVAGLCRQGKLVAHRNPSTRHGRGCWLILGKALESYCRRKASVAETIEGQYYVTPHAVKRFIERVAPDLRFEDAKRVLIEALRGSWPRTPLPRCWDGMPNVGYMLHMNYAVGGRRYICRVLVSYSDCNAVEFLPKVVTVL
jgi:hypothetical protein